jgi:hypothetical protein
VDAIALPHLDVEVGEGAATSGDRRHVDGGAIAEVAATAFDRDRDNEVLHGRHGCAGVEDDGRVAFLAGPVEEGQR